MCKQNVNVVTRLYDYVEYGESIVFQDQFDVIHVKWSNNRPYIGGFFIVTHINLLGTSQKGTMNFIENQSKVCFKIRITKLNSDEKKQYTWDLDEFTIDLSKKEYIQSACVKYMNSSKITQVEQLELRDDDWEGKYVIKVLILDTQVDKDSKDKPKWNVQSIMGLKVV